MRNRYSLKIYVKDSSGYENLTYICKKPSLLHLTTCLTPDVKNITYISEISPSTLYIGTA